MRYRSCVLSTYIFILWRDMYVCTYMYVEMYQQMILATVRSLVISGLDLSDWGHATTSPSTSPARVALPFPSRPCSRTPCSSTRRCSQAPASLHQLSSWSTRRWSRRRRRRRWARPQEPSVASYVAGFYEERRKVKVACTATSVLGICIYI